MTKRAFALLMCRRTRSRLERIPFNLQGVTVLYGMAKPVKVPLIGPPRAAIAPTGVAYFVPKLRESVALEE